MGLAQVSPSPPTKQRTMSGFSQYEYEDNKAMQPSGYAEYMSNYGEHFSKAMCEWAVSRMRTREGKRMEHIVKAMRYTA